MKIKKKWNNNKNMNYNPMSGVRSRFIETRTSKFIFELIIIIMAWVVCLECISHLPFCPQCQIYYAINGQCHIFGSFRSHHCAETLHYTLYKCDHNTLSQHGHSHFKKKTHIPIFQKLIGAKRRYRIPIELHTIWIITKWKWLFLKWYGQW